MSDEDAKWVRSLLAAEFTSFKGRLTAHFASITDAAMAELKPGMSEAEIEEILARHVHRLLDEAARGELRGDERVTPEVAATGARVLEALVAGRAKAHRLARQNQEEMRLQVLREMNREIVAGVPPRGRAGRIHRRLRPQCSLKTVQRILDALFSVSSSASDDPAI